MKATIKGFVTSNYDEYQFFTCEMKEYGYATVMPYSIEVEIPDAFDPAAAQVALLEAEKQKARAEFQARITEIDRQIQSLLAIEHVEPSP